MNATDRPATWAPYMTWAKHHPPARLDLMGSNLLHCTLDDLEGGREAVALTGANDEGYPPLVEAIAERYGVEPDRVATAPGAAGATFLALAALVRPGDAVVVEWPGYDPHAGAARLLGARVVTLPRPSADGFRVDPGAVGRALADRPAVVVITNLHNPSGVATAAADLDRIGHLAADAGVKVLVDEVYLEVATGVDTTPAARRNDAFVSVNSLTKSFGLSGLRVGWALADPATVERMRRVRDVVDGVGVVAAERLGALAVRQLDALLARARGIVGPNARLLRDFVEGRPELVWTPPAEGASVGFPRLAGVDDAGPFVDAARERFGVGTVPGRFFGAPAHFRVAVAGPRAVLEEGLDALGRALDAGAP